MAKIDDYIIQRIKDTADIVDVVGEFVSLKKSGVRYLGLCPFHDDKHLGSFVVYPKGNVFKCFACEASGGPIEFLMKHERLSFPDAIRWLGKKYSIDTDMTDFNYTPPPQQPKPAPLPPLSIPRSYVKRTMEIARERKVIFIDWLQHLPWDSEQRTRLSEVLWLYCVGGWRDGRVVFWMIDHDGNPRAAKLMQYLPDGHRDKEAHPGWIYNQDGCRQALDPDNHEIIKPLFGSHLLNRYPQAVVNIVESEKSALIMAIAYGNHAKQVWMACCGASNLTKEKLKPLIDAGRKIILYPDRDAIQAWQDRVVSINYNKATISSALVTTYWQPEDGEKADCADVVVRLIKRNNKMSPVEKLSDIMRRHPVVKKLVNKLNLEPI